MSADYQLRILFHYAHCGRQQAHKEHKTLLSSTPHGEQCSVMACRNFYRLVCCIPEQKIILQIGALQDFLATYFYLTSKAPIKLPSTSNVADWSTH